MATQLKINTSTSPVSLKEMTSADIDYSVNVLLGSLVLSDTDVDSIQINPGATAGLTLIGSFTDTYLNSTPGSHPIGTTPISTTYNFYQNQSSGASESLTRPIEYDTGVKEQNDTTLNAGVISQALANLVSLGVGSYQINSSSPTGGTWVNKSTLTNNLDATTSNVTYLWRKTAPASSPATVRPLKLNNTSPVSLKEMNDSEILTLLPRLKNRLASTGIGKCAVQATAPVSGGTWVTSGVAFLDTTRTYTNVTYSGPYTGYYTGYYTGTYTGFPPQNFTGTYTGYYASPAYAGTYTGYFAVYYAGRYITNYGVNYTGFYTGYYTGYYTGTYTGYYPINYTGTYTGYYTGYYTGNYTGATLNNDSSTVSTVYLWVRTA